MNEKHAINHHVNFQFYSIVDLIDYELIDEVQTVLLSNNQYIRTTDIYIIQYTQARVMFCFQIGINSIDNHDDSPSQWFVIQD